MASSKNRTLAMNLPRGEAGNRIEAALNIMMDEEDRSMSKTLLRIVVKCISDREPAFHVEVQERASEFERD